MREEFDAIIVGSGVLGSVLACTLGRSGRRTLLIERDFSEPDRIVGELLQPGGVEALQQLGLEHCLEGIDAAEARGYRVIYNGESVLIPYNRNRTSGQLYRGRSFHHGRFVMKLREAAKCAPNVTTLEAVVNRVISNPVTNQVLGVSYTRRGKDYSEHVFAPLTFVADGCFSKFRKEYIRKPVTVRSTFVGLILRDISLPSANYGHVILCKSSPVLLYQIDARDTRMLVDMPGKKIAVSNGTLKRHIIEEILPHMPASLKPAVLLALESPDRIRSMPNSWLPPSVSRAEGIALLGDAMNMRHPLTGGGMTVAFKDVVLLSSLLAPERVPSFSDTGLVLEQMRQFYWKRKGTSSAINILAQALYSLFSANDASLKALQEGCFRYFQLGGRCIEDPVKLLSGVDGAPLLLAFHFFAVAFYAIWIMFARSPWSLYPYTFLQSLLVLSKACIVFFPVVLSELTP